MDDTLCVCDGLHCLVGALKKKKREEERQEKKVQSFVIVMLRD